VVLLVIGSGLTKTEGASSALTFPLYWKSWRSKTGRCGEAVVIGVKHEFEATRDPEFVEDRGEVMTHCGLGNKQPFGKVSGIQPLADQGHDLALAPCERGDTDCIAVPGFGSLRR
jgi:hypothetical protein